jgi:hypothetical protein
MSWKTEFPNFPEADMPAIPEGWSDESWHNDACPFFKVNERIGVYVGYSDPKMKTDIEDPRFVIVAIDENGEVFDGSGTNDWNELLEFVKTEMES